jgi:hypothetical protein
LFERQGPKEVAEQVPEPTAEAEVTQIEGDAEAFCEIFGEFADHVDRRVQEYSEAASCVEDCGGRQILLDLEDEMDIYFDQLAEVAPPEIEETMTFLANGTMRGLSSSEGRPDLEDPLVEMDNFAREACGLSFIE